MTKYYHTHEEYHHDMKRIIEDIQETVKNPYIVGIFRGSLGMASHISNVLNCGMGIINYQTRDGEMSEPEWLLNNSTDEHTLVVVDDIYDTGKTLYEISKIVPESTKYYTLFNNVEAEKLPQSIHIEAMRESHGEWISFFWETV